MSMMTTVHTSTKRVRARPPRRAVVRGGRAPKTPPPLAARIDAIRAGAHIGSRDLAELLGTTAQTVSRWRCGRVEPPTEPLRRVLAVQWIVVRLGKLYGPAETRLWLYSPHELLGGATPAERLAAGRGDEVRALVAQLEDGAFV